MCSFGPVCISRQAKMLRFVSFRFCFICIVLGCQDFVEGVYLLFGFYARKLFTLFSGFYCARKQRAWIMIAKCSADLQGLGSIFSGF